MKLRHGMDEVSQDQIRMVLVVESVFGYCLNGGLVVLAVRLMFVSVVGGWSMAGDGPKGFVGFSGTLLGLATVLALVPLYWCWRGSLSNTPHVTSFHRLSDTVTFPRLLCTDLLIFALQYVLIVVKSPPSARTPATPNVPDAGPLHEPSTDPQVLSQSTLRRLPVSFQSSV